MNGVHDLGGMHGHGPVAVEQNEPSFHQEWERRVFGMFVPTSANVGLGIDEFRRAVEDIGPNHYLQTSYYEHWLHALETLLLEKGVISAAELESGKAAPGEKATPVLKPDMVSAVLAAGGSARVAVDVAPSFKVGDRVRTLNIHPVNHTRLPRYARDKVGIIEIDHGVFVTPDAAAHGLGQRPQHVYSVSFSAQELWGDNASAVDTVRIDLWDEYLREVKDHA